MEKQGEITRHDVTRRHTAIRMANDGRINIENLFIYLFTLFLRIFSSSNYYEIRIIAGMGQTPHLRNWVIGKGGQMKVRWRSADQPEKQGIRLHFACIMLVGVLGQNVTGQSVTDTMSWTKYYEDKMVLVKMSRNFVHDILSTTYYRRHVVRDILSVTFCPVTFCPATLVGIQPPCSQPDKNGGTLNLDTGNSSNDRL